MRENCTSGSMSGMWKRTMVGFVRHRQTKGAATDRPVWRILRRSDPVPGPRNSPFFRDQTGRAGKQYRQTPELFEPSLPDGTEQRFSPCVQLLGLIGLLESLYRKIPLTPPGPANTIWYTERLWRQLWRSRRRNPSPNRWNLRIHFNSFRKRKSIRSLYAWGLDFSSGLTITPKT